MARLGRASRAFFLGAVLLLFILPILWTVLASLNLQPDNTVMPPAWPHPPSLDNYLAVRAEQTFFWQELATSILVSATVMILVAAISLPAAYGLARMTFRGRNLLVYSFLVLASLPAISYAIPLGLSLRQWHLYDSLVGVVLAETAALAPLSVFLLVGCVARVPEDLEAEARLNGAALHQVFWRVILPGLAPELAATCALIFVLSWNQFVIPLVLSGTHIRVIPVMLRDFFALDREFEWPKAAAVIIISLLPVSAFVVAVHRILERFHLTIATDVE